MTITGTTNTGLRAHPWLGYRGAHSIAFWSSPNYPASGDGGPLLLAIDGGRVDGGCAAGQDGGGCLDGAWVDGGNVDGGFKDSGLVQVHISDDGGPPIVETFPLLTGEAVSSSTVAYGLAAHKTYSYKYVVDGKEDITSRSIFHTPVEDGTSGKFIVVAVSCMNPLYAPAGLIPNYTQTQPWWDAIKAWFTSTSTVGGRVLISLGDESYVERHEATKQQGAQRVQRNVPQYVAVTASIASLVKKDDHNCAGTDFDKTFLYKNECNASMAEQFPMPVTSTVPGATWFKQTMGDVDFFMLETRDFRDPKTSTSATKSILGSAQKAWLLRELRASQATYKLIVSASAFYGLSTSGDGWRIYPLDYYWLTSTVMAEVPGILLIVGDLHQSLLGEQIKLGAYPRVIEIVTSGIGKEGTAAFPTPVNGCRFSNIPPGGLAKHFAAKLEIETTTRTANPTPSVMIRQTAWTEGSNGQSVTCTKDGGTGVDGGLLDLGVYEPNIDKLGSGPYTWPAADGGSNKSYRLNSDVGYRVTLDMVTPPDSGVQD